MVLRFRRVGAFVSYGIVSWRWLRTKSIRVYRFRVLVPIPSHDCYYFRSIEMHGWGGLFALLALFERYSYYVIVYCVDSSWVDDGRRTIRRFGIWFVYWYEMTFVCIDGLYVSFMIDDVSLCLFFFIILLIKYASVVYKCERRRTRFDTCWKKNKEDG